jgi:hypothetical protein
VSNPILLPLEMKIERIEEPFDTFDIASKAFEAPAPPRYHVTAVLLNVERRSVVSYEFWSMVDPSQNPIEDIGRITHTSISGQRKRLSELRDALDKLLKDEAS